MRPPRAGAVPRFTARARLEAYGRRTHWLEAMAVNPFDALSTDPLSGLPPTMKLIWCYFMLEGKAVAVTNRGLAEHLGLASKSVLDAVTELERLGLLEVVDRGGGKRSRVVQAVAPKTSSGKER
jgi:DNA-binding MarR family transcriptional regulator